MNRFGPGSTESTLRAACFYPKRNVPIRILDIGCGIGTHTFLLAKQFPKAQVVGIDYHAPYIEKLNQTAAKNRLTDRVHGVVMSMFDMAFEKESFDMIWAEGSIYIIGFQRGLRQWRPY